ncbi:MAG TPA: hypothetical protein VEW93_05940 [Acidimicrobiales bacterium]|nr:hypothetical protein [Acidimicrobiales bacterium]
MGLFRRGREESASPLPGAAPADPLAAIDRAAVPPRLLPAVDGAVAAAVRYRGLVASRPEGPVRDRVAALGSRVDAGAVAVYQAALQARRLDEVATTLDPVAVTAAYKEARRRHDADPELVEVHRARFESVQRILNTREELDGRLELLQVRLEAAVARAAELALSPSAGVEAVEADLRGVTDELTGLRAGLDALS